MQKKFLVTLAMILIGLPSLALARDARGILETMKEKQLQRWAGVDVYVVEQSIMGNSTETYFQRTEIEDPSGNEQTVFLPVLGGLSGSCLGQLRLSPEAFDAYAAKIQGTASRGKKGAGSSASSFYDPRMMEQFLESARLVGTESLNGRTVFHLHVADFAQVQAADGQEYRMDSLDMWIDSQEYVPLRMKMDGTLIEKGQTRPISIENTQMDYRSVPGSNMFEPFQHTMKISGVMDAEQEAQLREAQAQMEQLESQMAGMPASQRKMMEKMLGSQLDMVKNMASGGGIQIETVTESITVNPPMEGADGRDCPTRMVELIQPPRAPIAAPTKTVDAAPASRSNVPVMPVQDAASTPASDPSALQAAQQACLQQRLEMAQKKQKKKKGFRRMLGAVGRAAGRFGGNDLASLATDIYDVSATADEFSAAAKDMGLTEDDVAACRNPS